MDGRAGRWWQLMIVNAQKTTELSHQLLRGLRNKVYLGLTNSCHEGGQKRVSRLLVSLKVIEGPLFGGRGATLDLSPAQRAG